MRLLLVPRVDLLEGEVWGPLRPGSATSFSIRGPARGAGPASASCRARPGCSQLPARQRKCPYLRGASLAGPAFQTAPSGTWRPLPAGSWWKVLTALSPAVGAVTASATCRGRARVIMRGEPRSLRAGRLAGEPAQCPWSPCALPPTFRAPGLGRGEKGAQDSRAWGSVLTQKVLTGWQ